ncbi:hypothetical protein KQI65_10535 [bacterium]|nr:hypothetical protein [bacterium]
MKATLSVLTLVLVLATTSMTQAQDAKPLSDHQQEMIKKNVLANLHHSSLDVRAATMQLLIDMKKTYPSYDMSYATIPLMETLKNDEKPEFRILAALALYHLDSELGRFAVERRAKYDSDERVARHCATLAKKWDSDRQDDSFLATVQREL